MSENGIELRYFGPFRAASPRGHDVTPKSARARALLALLGEAPDAPRSRRWLEDKLWSDRTPKQAGASLRQVLTEIRNALGDDRDILRANRLDIQLDPARLSTDLDSGASGGARHLEILEGLDVPDPEFEDWLRDFRARIDARADKPTTAARAPARSPLVSNGLILVGRIGDTTGPMARATAGILADQIGHNLEDGLGAVRYAVDVPSSDIEISASVTEDAHSAILSAEVVHTPTGNLLYSGHRNVTKSAGPLLSERGLAEFAHDISNRAIARLPFVAAPDREEIAAIGFAELGKRRLFSYDPAQLATADDLLSRAYNADPNGLFLAWQAFQRTTKVIEGLCDVSADLLEEAQHLLHRAVEISPESAQVHAIVALVRLLLFDDPASGLSAAESAIRRNPRALFPRQALAMTAGAYGDSTAAYHASSFCRPALQNEDARHLWDLYHGLVCISTGRWTEAREALETAVRYCPTFKAPHRQLIALNLKLGDQKRALKHLQTLKHLETGFSIFQYANDPAYPVSTLRQAGLLDASLQDVLG